MRLVLRTGGTEREIPIIGKATSPKPIVWTPTMGLREVVGVQQHPEIRQGHPYLKQIIEVPEHILRNVRRQIMNEEQLQSSADLFARDMRQIALRKHGNGT